MESRADTSDGDEPEGEAARERLLGLLTDAAAGAARAGMTNGVPADRSSGSGRDGPVAVPGGATRADPRHPVPFLRRACELAIPEVGATGAGVTVMGSVADGLAGRRDQLASTGGLSRRLEDLQLTAGHGPCLDAFAGGAPVLVGDLAADAARWPGFAPEALTVGVAAVFSLPLQVGAVRLGTFDLYRHTVGPLAPSQLAAALLLAGLITETLLDDHDGPGGDGGPTGDAGWLANVHAEVHQASGIVAAAEHIGVGEALSRIRAHAYAQDQPIDEVAARIIDRELTLSDPPG